MVSGTETLSYITAGKGHILAASVRRSRWSCRDTRLESPVHPVSESRGGTLSVTQGWTENLVSNIVE